MKIKKIGILSAICLYGIALFISGFLFGNKKKTDFSYSNGLFESILMVETFDTSGHRIYQGTGFCAIKEDYIFTAAHVVDGMDHAVLSTESGDKFRVLDIIVSDDVADVAILRLPEGIKMKPLPFSESIPNRGSDVTVIGCPRGFLNLVTKGTLAGVREMTGFQRMIFTAPVYEGSSGSPVTDSDGNVIALVTAKYPDSDALNLATCASFLLQIGNEAESK